MQCGLSVTFVAPTSACSGPSLLPRWRRAASGWFSILSELGSWSLVAQAMVLHVDRRLRSHGRHLVLLAPSAQLRAQSDRLDVFGVVETRPAAVGGIGSRRRLPGSD